MSETYLLGGYTKRENTGIRQLTFDSTTQQFSDSQPIATLNNSTFLTLSTDKIYLFALHKGNEKSGVVAFKRNGENWKLCSEVYSTDVTGCHLVYHEASQTVFVANYHEGSIDSYSFRNEQLTPLQRIEHQGKSVHPNQQSPHVHFVGFTPDQQFLLVCDLGIDQVIIYRITESGQLQRVNQFAFPAGTGPRHLIHHATLPLVFVIGELNNTVNVMHYDAQFGGTLMQVQTLSTQSNAASAAIRLSRDGKFLYASTRFDNLMSVFEVAANGELTLVQQTDSHGDIPRDFILSANEDFVLVAHQDSDHLSLFQRNSVNGKLTFVHNKPYAPECVCLIQA